MALAHSPRIVRDSLILYVDAANPKSYPGSGTTWKDLSDRGHDMTLVNGPTFNSGFGGYLKFDGSNDSATVEIDNLAGSSKDATVSIWMDGDYGNSTHRGIIGFRQSNGGAGFYILRLHNSNDKIEMRFGNSGGDTDVHATGTSAVPNISTGTRKWCNLCMTYSHSNELLTGYYNGKVIGTRSKSTGGYNSTMKTFAIARSVHSTGHYANMKASSAMLYEKCLLSSEVEQNYNALKGRFGY